MIQPRTPAQTDELIAAVRAYASDHYEDPGTAFDVVVECWDRADILRVIGRTSTVRGALWKVRRELGPWSDRRNEVGREIF